MIKYPNKMQSIFNFRLSLITYMIIYVLDWYRFCYECDILNDWNITWNKLGLASIP